MNDVLRHHRPRSFSRRGAQARALMEENPCEAIKNNVRGTRIVAEAPSVTASTASS